MTLQDRGGQLMDYLAQLSECEEICCECVPFAPDICECISGGDHPLGAEVPATLAITIPGDMSECTVDIDPPLCGPFTGANFAGTYFVICDEEVPVTPGDSSGKQETLREELTFACTRGTKDWYVRELLLLVLWRIPGTSSRADVIVQFVTVLEEYNTGDDPDVDPPLSTLTTASRTYNYEWPVTLYYDECGIGHQACLDLTLDSTFTSSIGFAECSHSTTVADYTPTVVRIGTL